HEQAACQSRSRRNIAFSSRVDANRRRAANTICRGNQELGDDCREPPTLNVFVHYQRADTALAAHALAYALRLGRHEAFVDTGDIGVGGLYRQVIANAVSTSNVMLALIGPSFDAQRLHEPTSVVTSEWQRARFHGTALVPVLV